MLYASLLCQAIEIAATVLASRPSRLLAAVVMLSAAKHLGEMQDNVR